jgi:hypothetical protein
MLILCNLIVRWEKEIEQQAQQQPTHKYPPFVDQLENTGPIFVRNSLFDFLKKKPVRTVAREISFDCVTMQQKKALS